MKKLLYAFLFSTLSASLLYANGGILVGGGMTFSNYTVSDNLIKMQTQSGTADISYKSLPGIKLNWNYWYECSKRIGIITGINFETRGSKVESTCNGLTTTTDYKLHYFTIPIYASITLLPEVIPGVISDFSVSAGPEFGIIIRMNNEAPSDIINLKDLGASVNCSVALFKTFSVGAGYEWGYANILKNPKDNSFMKNNALKVFINYIYRAKNERT